MASQHNHQGPALPPLQDFPPLGAGSPPGHEIFRGSNGRPPQSNMNSARQANRMSGDWRSNAANASKPIPSGPHSNAPNVGQRPFGPGGFEGPRSPPNAKNTSHVPCKFFKVNQCQAGKACPFSHSTEASRFEQPCKYFSKGNCKFGQKCALLHILPNGRVVNKPELSVGGTVKLGPRVDPPAFHNQESALGNSLLSQQVGGMHQPFSHQIPQHIPDFDQNLHVPPRSQPYDIPQPGSNFSTPGAEPQQAMSPIPHLSTLDAPLPASFDSNGVSYMAIHGPIAASMPSKIGHASPSSSLPKKIGHHGEGPRNFTESNQGNSSKGFNLGSSPLGHPSDAVGQRIMHSQRVTRQNRLSASLPRTTERDWEQDEMLFGNEEEWIPAGLSHLMTPEERNRRSSGKVENPIAIRESLAGNGTPNEMSTKIGSPGHASPSRYSVWNKPKTDDEHSTGFPSPSFGPVGSPLRNASLHPGASPSLRAARGASDLAFKVSSPPRHSSTSMLSQQLRSTRISSRASESSEGSSGGLHPIRHTSNPRSAFDRAVSSSSVTAERIDEEHPEMVFSLEEEEYGSGSYNKSNSNIWGPAGINRNPSGQQNKTENKDAVGNNDQNKSKQ